MARAQAQIGPLRTMPLILVIWGMAALSMWVPAIYALALDNHPTSRSFFYSGILGLILVAMIGVALSSRRPRRGALGQLLALMATFTLLPLFLAVPFHDALRTTSFLNAYFDMASAITTTGANTFPDPARLSPALHLWRAQVGWMGGLLMWVAASAILAPLSLGGFEITARGEPGRAVPGAAQSEAADPRGRLIRVARTLAPIYAGLTAVLWILLLIAGDPGLTALSHAMSVMATSGISPVGGMAGAQTGITGEAVLFLFMFFALSRLTFSSDTAMAGQGRLDRDPEFRIGLLIVIAVPLMLFLRHWLAAYEVEASENLWLGLEALWGSLFTVMSFLTTTGFESANWDEAAQWSGLGTPGLILMGLAVIGGGVATTAGGVKLLRVFALYLNGLREMERLVHPSSVSRTGGGNRRIQRGGAFIAWIFFMLFALSLAAISVALAALGMSFEQAIVMSIAGLSTTGPLMETAVQTPIRLADLDAGPKLVLCAAMVIGRLETLAIIALITPDLWRS
ncbi:trk system potassium uptake protein TrkH [Cribrihabitans marinus]|uniref:Trk system potassium uptake protein TrkH n=1 Tax=Cribrihabitans marinus TaxID=1227549 RepID=A0A1H6VQI6_9RHOB|nr:potassium transporter TrkG [Cribrihabitans marinus]GGH25330.1 potassium transporter TrkH [Cribrihabitans marinus]SEJ06883.1 trk system potassium uptake protein TrkH [Cribrihabitans marinus]